MIEVGFSTDMVYILISMEWTTLIPAIQSHHATTTTNKVHPLRKREHATALKMSLNNSFCHFLYKFLLLKTTNK
jgi:hypothetical protein